MALANLTDILERVYVEGDRRFNAGYASMLDAPSEYSTWTYTKKTNAKRVDFPFVKDFPKLEKLSDKAGGIPYADLEAATYSLTPEEYGTGIKMKEADVSDDTYGIVMETIDSFTAAAAIERGRQGFDVIKSGIATTNYGACHDDKAFFATDHPVGTSTDSNYDSGGGATPWYLLDCSKPIKPFVEALRLTPEMSFFGKDSDWFKDNREFKWNIYTRLKFGYAMWQLGYCSNQSFTEDNLWNAIEAMREMKNDQGMSLNIRPTHLLCAPDTEQAASNLIKRMRIQGTAAAPSNEPVQELRLQLVVNDYLT